MSAKLMGQVWDLDLPHNLQLVLLSLADHAQHDGTGVFPGVELTAYKTGYSIRQVRRVLRQLEAAGLIVPTAREDGGRGHATEYELHFENGTRKPPYSRLKGDKVMSAFSDPDERQPSALKGDKAMSAFSDPGEGQPGALKGDKMSAFSDPDERQASALKGDKMSAFSETRTSRTIKADISGRSGRERRTFRVLKADIAMSPQPYPSPHVPSREPSIIREPSVEPGGANAPAREDPHTHHQLEDRKPSVSEEFREEMRLRYRELDVDAEITNALNRKSARQVIDVEVHVAEWLRKSRRWKKEEKAQAARPAGRYDMIRSTTFPDKRPVPEQPAREPIVITRPASGRWHEVLERLRECLLRPTFDTWLAGTVELGWGDDGTLVVGVPNEYVATQLYERCGGLIEREAGCAVAFETSPDGAGSPGVGHDDA